MNSTEKIYDMFKNLTIGCLFELREALCIKTDFAENSELSEIYNCVNIENGRHGWIDLNETVEIIPYIE